jgi:cytidylate kinase
MTEPVVTISASYGAAGSVVAPALAERLGWPFIDRLVTSQLSSDALALRSKESLTDAEAAHTPPNRFLASLARAAGVGAVMPPEVVVVDTELDLREQTESALSPLVAGGRGVVLGRAAAVILADRPRTLHVRLDGPVERRIERAAELEGISTAEARSRQGETDRARTLFVRRLYHRDPEDVALYHLRIDTTILSPESVVKLLLVAIEASIAF